jgi:hypothetical protein
MCLWATNLLFEQQLGNKNKQISVIGQQKREECLFVNPIKTSS